MVFPQPKKVLSLCILTGEEDELAGVRVGVGVAGGDGAAGGGGGEGGGADHLERVEGGAQQRLLRVRAVPALLVS
jgi:hypothetical protein